MQSHEEPGVFDFPDHEGGSVPSSIGGIGEPRPDSFGRLKGFYQGIVDNQRDLIEVVRQFWSGVGQLTDGGVYTRVQHRAIFDRAVLQQNFTELQPCVEAIIPLDAGHLGREPVLVYLGAITPSRSQNADDLAVISENLARASRVVPRNPADILKRPRGRGYEISILSEEDRRDVEVRDQIAGLYERFGWSSEEVGTMLQNQNNILCVARRNGRIVSSGIGEMAVIPLDNTQFRIAEITEAATLVEHESNGCYAAISTTILSELVWRSRAYEIFDGELDLVFGESNGLSGGVLSVAATQARTFSTNVAGLYGFERRGILRQQVPISGSIRRTSYNDLVVTSLTRSNIYDMF